MPDVHAAQAEVSWGATVLVNATSDWQSDMELVARVGRRSKSTPVPPLPPLGMRKVGFRIPAVRGATGETQRLELDLRPRGERGAGWAIAGHELRVRAAGQSYRETFVSAIDGSVQYFAVQPQTGEARDAAHHASDSAVASGAASRALFLSLHGASVEAMGQADAYAPKGWGVLVAPTNRRPYGFDWEEWGRRDALEVLDLATRRFAPDPDRIYLTGHSMGGHGTWSLGATFPDRFGLRHARDEGGERLGPGAGAV